MATYEVTKTAQRVEITLTARQVAGQPVCKATIYAFAEDGSNPGVVDLLDKSEVDVPLTAGEKTAFAGLQARALAAFKGRAGVVEKP